MSIENWIAIGIAVLTGLNSWGQFLVKERVLTDRHSSREPLLDFAKSRLGVVLIGSTGLLACVSAGLLVREVVSPEPLTRSACFFISLLCVLVPLNLILVFALLTTRRLALLSKEIKDSEDRARSAALAYTFMFR